MSQVFTPESGPESRPRPGSRTRFLVAVVTLAGVLGAGLLGGYVAASQKTGAGGGGHGHGHGHGHEEGGEGHEGHAHGEPAVAISARALANLGVEVGSADLSDYVRSLEVPAEVEVLPLAERPVSAPVGGTVRRIFGAPGETLAAGAPLAEIVRDAFPAPTLSLTQGLLQPLNEEYHATLQTVRTASLAHNLAQAELERLKPGESPAGVTGRVVREAEYAVQRAQRELENARREAERHGLTDEQIAALEGGKAAEIPDTPNLRRVFEHNGLWTTQADALQALLPADVRTLPHTLALLAELVGGGRLTAELVASVQRTPALAASWLDVAGLVQQGTTTAALEALAQQGALDAVVVLKAPEGAPTWDVTTLGVRAGERVIPGTEVARVRDDRRMALHLQPAPSDMETLEKALTGGGALTAEPLVAGSGPHVSDVRLVSLTGRREGERPGALATAPNAVVAERETATGGRARTWALRPGMRLVVLVPIQTLPKRFVLPGDAIAYRAAEAVVLLEDGDTFKPVPVRLEHHDARSAVVAADGAIFPGDRIALHGAPALGMALMAKSGGADPHAGHSH